MNQHEEAVLPPYRVIEGERVDLLCPFPEGEIGRVWGWTKNFKNLLETDDSPHGREDFTAHLRATLPEVVSYAIIDKTGAMKRPVPAALAGILVFEPQLPFNGYLHVASARSAYGHMLTDEGAKLACADLFERLPKLSRISALVHERNRPAGALARRCGFKREGVLRDAIVQLGEPKNVIIFGLTRAAQAAAGE